MRLAAQVQSQGCVGKVERGQMHLGDIREFDGVDGDQADLAYAGKLVVWAKPFLRLTIKTVSRPKGAQGFVILHEGGWQNDLGRG